MADLMPNEMRVEVRVIMGDTIIENKAVHFAGNPRFNAFMAGEVIDSLKDDTVKMLEVKYGTMPSR